MATQEACLTIKILRERLEVSQESFAERLQVSRALIAKWEQGRKNPTISDLAYLAQICQRSAFMDLEEIFLQLQREKLHGKDPGAPREPIGQHGDVSGGS